jgi:hypothetical protein
MESTKVGAAAKGMEVANAHSHFMERRASRMKLARAGLMAALTLGGEFDIGWGGHVRRALSSYRRAVHPRAQAYRVGAWAGDGVPPARESRQVRRAKERRLTS